MRIPNAYYLGKRQLGSYLKRWKYLISDKGSTEARLDRIDFNCLFVYEALSASTEYRVFHAAKSLSYLGLSCLELPLSDLDKLNRYNWLDSVNLIILHRLPLNYSLARLLRRSSSQKIPIILDLDDAIHDPDIYCLSPVFDHLNTVEQAIHRNLAKRVRKTLEYSQLITTSTETLSEQIQRTGVNSLVIPNRVSSEMIEASQITTQQIPSSPVIGYVCGTSTHHRDFASISKPVIQCMTQIPDTILALAGPLSLPLDFPENLQHRITRFPLQSWPDFLEYYSKLTINLAPLEQNNAFCLAKSGIKYLEAALSAVPTIASPTPDFQRLITHGRNGFLAETESDWLKWMIKCITDQTFRDNVGTEAREHVLNRETINNNDILWNQALRILGVLK